MIKLSVNVNKVATVRNSRGGQLPSRDRGGARRASTPARRASRFIRVPTSGTSDARTCTRSPRELAPLKRRASSTTSKAIPARIPRAGAGGQAGSVHAGAGACPARSRARRAGRRHARRELRAIVARSEGAPACASACSSIPSRRRFAGRATIGADRVELYTEPFARAFERGPRRRQRQLREVRAAADLAHELGLGVNAGHDLDLGT